MNLFSLYAKIGLDTSEYEKEVNKTKSSANGLKGVFTSLTSVIGGVGLKSKTAATEHKVLAAEFKEAKSRVAELSAEYVKSAKETGTTSEKTRELQEKLKDAKGDVEELRKEMEKYPGAMDKAKTGMSKFTNALGIVGGTAAKGFVASIKGVVTAVGAAGTAIGALGSIGMNYNSQTETYTTNFEVMLGIQEAAAKKVEELKTMAAKTPFEMADLAKGTQTLLAFNVASDESTGVLSKLGDISLGNSEKLDSLTRAYGKMNAAQKVTLEDINMMIDFCPAA